MAVAGISRALLKTIMKKASKMTPLERQQYYRSFGKPKKEGIHTAVIGKSGEKGGLYYDPNLPFIETYPYFRKPSATARAIAKEKGRTLKDQYPETRSRFIQPEEKDPFVMAQMTADAKEGWRHRYVKVRQSEANWNDKAKKWVLPLSKDSIRNPNRAKRIQEVVDDVSDNPEKHGLKLDPTKKIRIPYGSYTTAVNKVLNNEGYKDIPASSIKNAIVAKQGTSIIPFKGTDTEKKLHKFLKTTDPETKKPYFETITATELREKLPWLKVNNSTIDSSRNAVGLQRTNIGKSEDDKVRAKVVAAVKKVKQKVKEKYSYLSDDELEAMMEQSRIMLGNLKPGYKKEYPDKTINEVFKFIEDTEVLNRGKDPYYTSYLAEKSLNRLRTALTGDTYTMGHARKEAADTWWFPGYETPTISPQKWDMNFKQRSLDSQFQAAMKRGDYDAAQEAMDKMVQKGMRSSMVDDYGEQIFFGAPPRKGKLARGGKVDGLAAGGIANISRRLFLKGLGALAGKTALPKTVSNLLPDVKETVKMDSAPWINSMVNTVKKAADTGQSFSLGNGAKISYLKAPQNQYQPHQLSIKTVDGFEDRINFKEGKNDIDIEFDIRDDFNNNQHIYVDKKAGTTELVDDNYYMTSPEDFAKDDPIIWDVNKKDIRETMILDGTTKADDYMYDYMSVPNDSDYSFMWERYVDSFSPYGNIFKTKQLADKEKAKKLLQEEMDEMRFEEQFRGGNMHGFNRGGIMKDVVPPLDEYAAGGVGRLILKQAPKVINKLREFAPQITGKPGKPADLKAVKSGDTYYTVFDEDGLAIKDFPNEKVARDFIRNNEFADMYTMGKSTDDTLTAATQSDAPAMFFRSREEIIQGPPIMKGEEWLNFLQKRGIREGELSDTSLGPWLNANKGNKISKNDLVEKFDGMVPDFDVDVTGQAFELSNNISSVLKKVDPSVYDPESAGVIRFLQTRLTDIVDEKSGAKALDDLDNVFEKAYGVKNVSQEGIPAGNINVPYEVKQLMAEAMSGAGKRGVNLQGSAFVDRPAHAGSQTLSGGQNHREFIFRYNPKGPRKNEPIYNYAHSFGRAKTDNAFMHARISDRVDEYGNKLLFVEEFQSDMHQPISAAVREATKAGKAIPKEGKYAPRLDKEVAKLNKDNLEQMANIQRQIDRLLETKPDSPKLAKLYEQKEIIRNIEKDKAGKLGKNTSNIPEGPFKNSQDYMEFAIKYLLRVAKDGNYDGVAFSTPAIKNRSIGPDNRDYKGNLIAYGDILKNAIRKAKSKSGADLFETTIGSGRSYGDAPQYYGVPALMIKGNTKALEKISKGLPAYNEGGLVQNVFNDVVPTL